MMSMLNNLRLISTHFVKCRPLPSIPLKIVAYSIRWNATGVRLPSQNIVVTNLCEKLKCSEIVAKSIYDKCPMLRSMNSLQNDSMEMLCKTLSLQSIIENPELMTMNIDALQRKIDLLNAVKPKRLDDFAPLLQFNENELKDIVCKRMKNERGEVGEYGNRIYYLSEKLQVEPKLVSQRIFKGGYKFFEISFATIRKKIEILLDYGVDRMDIVNCLNTLGTNNDSFIRRSERMVSIALPIKMWHYSIPNDEFDRIIEKYKDKCDKQNAVEITDRLRKQNLDKNYIIKELKSLLECDDIEASELYYNHLNSTNELDWAKENIKYLLKISVSRNAIRKHGSLLTLPFDELDRNAKIVMEMMPKHIDDFIPLVSVETDILEAHKCALKTANVKSIGSDHPIYYFSERLNIPADEVAANFAKRYDVFLELNSPELLKSKLNILLKYDVDRASILRSKKTFRQSPKQIEKILCKLRDGGVEKILSYMISCPKQIIASHSVEKKSLEGFDNNIEYIAHRLNWSKDDIEKALNKHQDLLVHSPSKVKEHLDYLLNEVRLEAKEITKRLYIFDKSLSELKARTDELPKIGAPITVDALNKHKAHYLKYVKKYCNEENEVHKTIMIDIEVRLKSSRRKMRIKKPTN